MLPPANRDKISNQPNFSQLWPGIEVFRLALVVNDPITQMPGRMMRHGFRDIEPWRKMDKTTSAINATLWEQTLIELLKEGTPAQAMDMLMSGTLRYANRRPVYSPSNSVVH